MIVSTMEMMAATALRAIVKPFEAVRRSDHHKDERSDQQRGGEAERGDP
jgi:hypothetical protein